MTTIEHVDPPALDALFSECFSGGEILRRELRLTELQAQYLCTSYPAVLRPIGEQWYEITFQGGLQYGD